MPRKAKSTSARRSARIEKYRKKFEPYRKAALAAFKKAHGRVPKSFDDWASINKKAGAAYRRDK